MFLDTGSAFKYARSSSVKRKLLTKRRHSSRPANTVNSPPKGFFRNSRSNAAGRSCVPFFQYAYAMVIWYVSMSNAVVRLFVHGGMRRAPPAEPPEAGLRGAIAEASAGTNHAGRRIDASGSRGVHEGDDRGCADRCVRERRAKVGASADDVCRPSRARAASVRRREVEEVYTWRIGVLGLAENRSSGAFPLLLLPSQPLLSELLNGLLPPLRRGRRLYGSCGIVRSAFRARLGSSRPVASASSTRGLC
mmetsp:Transcript_6785/g.27697  ORF Transcript_6785/g.27697 Transcript_6785/m.27697 type:complete len:249 (-) Transcript_6785:433-1179(-)